MYAIWKACERFGILPPDVEKRWEDMDDNWWLQGLLIAYDQIRSEETIPNFDL